MWLQSKVEEAKFNDVPARNCDIPGTFAVLVKKNPWGPSGGQLSQNKKGTPTKVFKVGRESPWDASLDEPVLRPIRM